MIQHDYVGEIMVQNNKSQLAHEIGERKTNKQNKY